MMRDDGFVKVLDFGLAKLLQQGLVQSEAPTLVNTADGVVLGTLSYMSPEQAQIIGQSQLNPSHDTAQAHASFADLLDFYR